MTNFIIKKFIVRDDLEEKEQRARYGYFSGITGVIFNILLSVTKMFCGFLFASISVLSDGINNLSDAGSSIITLVGFKMAEKPADEEHPFGHARMEYVSGFVVSCIIVFVGLNLLVSSVKKIISPTEMEVNVLVICVLIISIIIKAWLFHFNKKVSTITNSKTILGVAIDSRNDIFITLGVLISIVIYLKFNVNLDGFVGAILSALILKSGIEIAKDTISQILGEAPSKDFITEICKEIHSYDYVLGVHDVIVHSYGYGRHFVSAHVEFDSKLDFVLCHEIADKIERDFHEKNIYVVVHSDPVDTSCEISNKYKKIVLNVIYNIDNNLKLHDFRVVKLDESINLIFDVVLPASAKISPENLKEKIKSDIKNVDTNCNAIIQIDRHYNEG